ncbi:ABC transporter ATP-binding protein [Blastococcus sp. TF02-8]|uniref:ABC transporter ATP-binding protein n=1 Tax=Blastococcus sp. TF02-8 TaxID=2250574 RepID=UPI000DE9163C|nr:ABC transporter ATP-binding protein [Blastococcus sp. TF02-8]RBY95894.1 ABC transporter ATP-binding protein [Blastococcus sp. TF02-8]
MSHRHGLAIDAEGLTVAYGDHAVVRGVDLQVHEGEVVALLGPNGAGKTTTIEVLEGLRRRTAGRVRVLGLDPGVPEQRRQLRRDVGVVLQKSALDPFLTVLESVRQRASYYRLPLDPVDALELVDLVPLAGQLTRRLSGGQQRRLDLALALVGRPRLLFLDEPTTGLDPEARRSTWSFIQRLRDDGTGVLLTTHYLDEAEQLADRLLVMSGGATLADGTHQELDRLSQGLARITFTLSSQQPVPGCTQLLPDGTHVLDSRDVPADVHALLHWAATVGVDLVDLQVKRPSLEEVYMSLTGAGHASSGAT